MADCGNSNCAEFLAEVRSVYAKMIKASGEEKGLLACEYNSKAIAYMHGMSDIDPCRNKHHELDMTYSNEIYMDYIERR